MPCDILEAILTIVNANSRFALSRDCECVRVLRDLLVRDGSIRVVDLYTCEVSSDGNGCNA